MSYKKKSKSSKKNADCDVEALRQALEQAELKQKFTAIDNCTDENTSTTVSPRSLAHSRSTSRRGSRQSSRQNSRQNSRRASRKNSFRRTESTDSTAQSSCFVDVDFEETGEGDAAQTVEQTAACQKPIDLDLSCNSLETRFGVAITQKAGDHGRCIYVCRDAEHPSALCVKTVATTSYERKRLSRETAVHRQLFRIFGFQEHIIGLVSAWCASNMRVCYVIPLIKLGPLSDVISERNLQVTASRVQSWLTCTKRALQWLHVRAEHVHCATSLDNWLLQEPDALLLSNFDRCWSKENFLCKKNFDCFCKLDALVFVDELKAVFVREQRRDIAMLMDREVDGGSAVIDWHNCNAEIAHHMPLASGFCSYADERLHWRAQVSGSHEEDVEMSQFDAFEERTYSTSTSCAIRMRLARQKKFLHLPMDGSDVKLLY